MKVYSYGKTHDDVPAIRGYYAIDPSGHLCLIPQFAPLKPGWCLATQADVDARCKPVVCDEPAASEPEPAVEVAIEGFDVSDSARD